MIFYKINKLIIKKMPIIRILFLVCLVTNKEQFFSIFTTNWKKEKWNKKNSSSKSHVTFDRLDSDSFINFCWFLVRFHQIFARLQLLSSSHPPTFSSSSTSCSTKFLLLWDFFFSFACLPQFAAHSDFYSTVISDP